jgi:ADP-ribose pyrophosphatase YjhB (NUDIX family)
MIDKKHYNIPAAIDCLNSSIGDPTCGLPEEIFRFASSIVPMINVDLLIKNDKVQTLLIWREDEFFPPGWHIPGGIIRYKERVRDRINAVAKMELGTKVIHSLKPVAVNEIIMEQLEWRVRGHFISLLYECQMITPPTAIRAKKNVTPKQWEWDWHDTCPENLYESQKIYKEYFAK